MQLIIISIALFFLMLTQDLKAQLRKASSQNLPDNSNGDTTVTDVSTYERPDWQTIDINFLSSYYLQDGNNSPVTGGIGTEQLTDFTQKISITIPTSPKLSFNLDGGYDYYSSASTDNIDHVKSSDSSSDMRIHGNIGMQYQLNDQKTIGFRVGGSSEYDYVSINGGMNFGWQSKDQNTAITLGLQAFFDTWVLYYPRELRGSVQLPTDQRRSYNASMLFSRVLNKRMQFSLQVEGIYMQGLLSTPFHRVYFKEQEQAGIEMLPESRWKIPIGLRLNTHLTEWLIARAYYRYYWDDWGIQGHTTSLELPVKLSRFLSVYPFYRYHTQTTAKYFKPYKIHSLQDTYVTSDFDLSALNSHAYGIGVSYSPAGGLVKFKMPFKKRPVFKITGIDIKYSHYDRNTGLKADIVSIGLGFSF